MGQMIKRLGKTAESVISISIFQKIRKNLQPEKYIRALTTKVRKGLQSILHFIFGKPSALTDYFHVNDTYISKRFLAKFCIFVIVLVVIWIQFLYPYLQGRLWSASLLFNSSEYHEFSGKSKVYLENGNLLYQGTLEQGKAEGEGKLYNLDGVLQYVGAFSQNKYQGDGILYDENGTLLYEGQFASNLYEGDGKLYFANGNTQFVGTFAAGSYVTGTEYYPNGKLKYVGTYENGLFTGEASLYHNDAQNTLKYTGTFANGQYDGEGKLFQNGAIRYQGGFSAGLYQGTGTLYENDMVIYQGEFLAGKRNGQGRAYSHENSRLIYDGSFENNQYDGTGKLYDAATGRLIYSGEFVEGVYQGAGELYGSSGQKIYTGNFYQGEIDYMQYINADETMLHEAFGKEDALVMLDSSYLLLYRQLGVAFELGYVEVEETPQVERIRFWGDQTIQGVSTDMTIEEYKTLLGEDASYTEYAFLMGESEMAIWNELENDVPADGMLYSIKYILEDSYIRVYSDRENGKIVYFETGGI